MTSERSVVLLSSYAATTSLEWTISHFLSFLTFPVLVSHMRLAFISSYFPRSKNPSSERGVVRGTGGCTHRSTHITHTHTDLHNTEHTQTRTQTYTTQSTHRRVKCKSILIHLAVGLPRSIKDVIFYFLVKM